jgi:hypothetical protein
MTQGIHWRRGLAEFGIVVVGVAVALAAESWRQDLQDRRLGDEYLSRLTEEVREGQERVVEDDVRFDRVRAAAGQLIEILERGDPVIEGTPLMDLVVQAGQSGSNPSGLRHDTTYEELLATGNLRLIRDPAIRGAFVQYYRMAQALVDIKLETPLGYHDRFQSLTGHSPQWYISGSGELSERDDARLSQAVRNDYRVILELRRLVAHLEVLDEVFNDVMESSGQLLGSL